MKAVRIHSFGPPEVITVEDLPKPVPVAGEIVIKVEAAGVGRRDALIRRGHSAPVQPLPLTLGSDVAGVIDSIGPGVQRFEIGDEVFGVTNEGFAGAYARNTRSPKPIGSRPNRKR
jgi:NADPH:quinone reductase-like Zn-dependent oxidoreductase